MPDSTSHHKLIEALKNAGLFDHDETAEIIQLSGGYTNRVFRLNNSRKSWVVKQYAEISINPLYPIFPEDEHRALEIFSAYGYSPTPIALLGDTTLGKLLVYEWVEGIIWREHAEMVGQLLSAVHQVDAKQNFRQLPASIEGISDQTDWLLSLMEDHRKIKSTLDQYPTKRIHQTNMPQCIVHTDCGPGNIIVGHNGCKLIDLQCPGIGNPVEDLTNFSSPAIQHLYGLPPLTELQRANFLKAYENHSVIELFDWMLPVYSKRMIAYCAFREEQFKQSQPDISERYRTALALELQLLDNINY